MKKTKNIVINLKVKQEMIRKIESGFSKIQLARAYGLGKSTITDIYNNRLHITEFIQEININQVIERRSIVKNTNNHQLNKG